MPIEHKGKNHNKPVVYINGICKKRRNYFRRLKLISI